MRDDSPPTQELEPAALAMAADIRARVGPDLFDRFDDHTAERAWPEGVWSRPGEVPTFKAEAEIDAPPLVVAAIIKEADLGGLVGELLQWRVGRLSPFLELVHYVTRFPAPFSARDFCVTERYGVEEDGGVLVLGQDLHEGDLPLVKPSVKAIAEWQERGCVRGSVRRSAYQVSPAQRGGRVNTRLRRVIDIDLCMWVPASVCERLLARSLAQDFARMRAQAAAFAGSRLQQRTDQDWFYKVVRAHA